MATEKELNFLDFAVEKHYLRKDQKEEILENQRILEKMDISFSIWEILLKKDYLSREKLEKLKGLWGGNFSEGFQSVSSLPSLPPVIGGFEIREKIGEGAMGMVFCAHQLSMDRKVALKIISPHLIRDGEYVALFLREARSAAKLNHDHIVKAIASGRDGDYYYFAMEYVEGQNLGEYLEQKGALAETKALEIAFQMALALEHAESHGVIHRDIKPGNIFLTKDGKAKLGDFGLAKPQGDSRLSKTNVFCGSPFYISPEQMSGYSHVNILSDIYSLGITLYEMVLGHPPYQDLPYTAVLTKHYSEEIPSVRLENPELSKEIDCLISKMTRKDPHQRHQSPQQLKMAIEHIRKESILGREQQDLLSEMDHQNAETLQALPSTLATSKKDKPSPPSAEKEPPSKPKSKSILVVDDDEDMLDLMEQVLSNAGFEISTAQDGVDGLMELAMRQFDLIISDIQMPNMDGFRLLELKKLKGIETPTIFLTGHDDEEIELQGLELGAEDFIAKPIRPKILLARVMKILGNPKEQEES